MEIRSYSTTDYPILAAWWSAWGWPAIPEAVLPKRGYVVENDERMVAAGWLYQTDSSIWLLEWLVGNPLISKELRGQGLDALIAHAEEEVKAAGGGTIFTWLEHPGLIRRFSDHGYESGDKALTNMIKRI